MEKRRENQQVKGKRYIMSRENHIPDSNLMKRDARERCRLFVLDPSAFFMRKDAYDVTRKKICIGACRIFNRPQPTFVALHRAQLSKSHRADINPGCSATVTSLSKFQ